MHTDYYVSEHFAVAIEYGDTSGLTDSDVKAYEAFLERVKGEYGTVKHFSWDWEDGEECGTCEICGMRVNNTIRVTAHY